jgi:hypothetical protein
MHTGPFARERKDKAAKGPADRRAEREPEPLLRAYARKKQGVRL